MSSAPDPTVAMPTVTSAAVVETCVAMSTPIAGASMKVSSVPTESSAYAVRRAARYEHAERLTDDREDLHEEDPSDGRGPDESLVAGERGDDPHRRLDDHGRQQRQSHAQRIDPATPPRCTDRHADRHRGSDEARRGVSLAERTDDVEHDHVACCGMRDACNESDKDLPEHAGTA